MTLRGKLMSPSQVHSVSGSLTPLASVRPGPWTVKSNKNLLPHALQGFMGQPPQSETEGQC